MVKITKDEILADSELSILDFNIDTSGIGILTSNCKIKEEKSNTYTITNCTTIQCTTVQCTTIQCTTINCTTVKYANDNACNCNYCGNDS